MAISLEKIAAYREGLQRRISRPLTKTERLELDRAYAEAQHLAQELVTQHRARRVLLFGSVARRWPLRPDSDIDLAVEGMPSENYYQIVGDLQTSSGRWVDLVRLEDVRPAVRQIILLEGVVLAHDGG
jgi:predicted nucleotidyltransferase